MKASTDRGPPRRKTHPWIWKVGAAALLSMLIAGAVAAEMKLPPSGPQEPPGGFPTPCAQSCFDRYIENCGMCAAMFCSSFLWFTWCDDPQYEGCTTNAQSVFYVCLARCKSKLGQT